MTWTYDSRPSFEFGLWTIYWRKAEVMTEENTNIAVVNKAKKKKKKKKKTS